MAWFIGRSVVVIVLAFMLGLIVGWLWWRRQRVDALRAHRSETARLRSELAAARAAGSSAAGGDSSGSAAWRRDVPLTAKLSPTAPAAPVAPVAEADVEVEVDTEPVVAGAAAPPATEPAGGPAGGPAGEPAKEPVDEAGTEAAAESASGSEDEPEAEEELEEEEPAGDDLERVEGIGPRIGAALRGAGLTTFAQLADADTATLQSALEQAGLRFAPSLPTWSRQARFLADKDEEGFQALTQQLVGGRDVSGAK